MKAAQSKRSARAIRSPRPDLGEKVVGALDAEIARRRERRKAAETAARDAKLRNEGYWHPPEPGPLDFDQFCRESRDGIVARFNRALPPFISDHLKVEWARAARKALNASPLYGCNFLLRHSDPSYDRATTGAFFEPDDAGGDLDSILDELHHFRLWADGTYGGGWKWSATLNSHFEGARLAIEDFWAGVWAPEKVIGHVMMVIAELEQMPRKLEDEEAT